MTVLYAIEIKQGDEPKRVLDELHETEVEAQEACDSYTEFSIYEDGYEVYTIKEMYLN